ncbi:MAG: PIN domain-containing protein [Candidatus Methylomirabilota bacterium]
MSTDPVFMDTWGWCALGYRGDRHHANAVGCYRHLRQREAPIFTSDYVLDEVLTLLYRRASFAEATRFAEGILAAAALGHLTVERVTAERFGLAWALRKQLDDKPNISFTDLTSMVSMQERRIRHVFTEDAHFAQVGLGFSLVP